jgi:hypothetical protein
LNKCPVLPGVDAWHKNFNIPVKVSVTLKRGIGGVMTRMLPGPEGKTRPEISSSRDFGNPCEHQKPNYFHQTTGDDRAWVLEPFSTSCSTEKQPFDRLIDSLSADRREQRIAAAELLGRLGDSRAIEPLFRACMDEDGGVKEAARMALSRISRSHQTSDRL